MLTSALLTAALLLLPVARTAAENFDDIGGEKFTGVKLTGSVVRVQSGAIEVNTGDKRPLTVWVGQDALNAAFAKHKEKTKRDLLLKCVVIGTADFSFLRKDHGVSFTAELDKQRNGLADITELSVFTVDDTSQLTLIDTQAALDEGKAAPAKGGYYQVNGQINQLRKDGFTAKTMSDQGKKPIPVSVKVRVAADAKVSLRVADYLLAKAGDAIEIEGYTFTKNKKEVPGTLLAENVTITLAKPIGLPEKSKPAVARNDRRAEKKPAADADDEMPEPARQASGKRAVVAEAADDLGPDPGDPLPGKLIFRDKLTVDGDDAAGESTDGGSAGNARPSPVRPSPTAAPTVDASAEK